MFVHGQPLSCITESLCRAHHDDTRQPTAEKTFNSTFMAEGPRERSTTFTVQCLRPMLFALSLRRGNVYLSLLVLVPVALAPPVLARIRSHIIISPILKVLHVPLSLTYVSASCSPLPVCPVSVSVALELPPPQVWFIVAESVASACFGVARHVGERLTPHEICGSFEKMHKIFFR